MSKVIRRASLSNRGGIVGHSPWVYGRDYRGVATSQWCLLALAVSVSLLYANKSYADDYFDPTLLMHGGAIPVDLSQYEKANAIPEGEYLVDIFVNNNNVASARLDFKRNKAGNVVAQLTPEMLVHYGVKPTAMKLPSGAEKTVIDDLGAVLPQATEKFSVPQLRLDLSIPQAYVNSTVGGYVDPSLWEQGIPAFLMNYSLNGAKSWQSGSFMQSGSRYQNLYGNARGGINLGPWRLRSSYTYSESQNSGFSGGSRYRSEQFSNTNVQRNIASLNAEMTLGETSSGGEVLDGVPFRGIKLTSDDAMLPSSQRGFAPTVSGIAKSQALVTVTQNGNVIYQTNVAPGPFNITDIYQAGSSGDLTVTVTEADGSKHVSTQAYSTLPVMLRAGAMRYDVSVGRYSNGGYTNGAQNPLFGEATLVYGLPHYITLYGGGLASEHYQTASLGTGLSLGRVGALSADVTASRATLPGGEVKNGESYRLKYAKSMLATGTTVNLSAYRYSTKDYYSFSDANSLGYQLREDAAPWEGSRRRSSWLFSVSQSLGRWGGISVNGSRDDYWGADWVNNRLGVGYNTNYKGISYSLNYSLDRRMGSGNWPINRQLAFNMSVPLSLFGVGGESGGSYLSYGMNHDNSGRTSHQFSGGGSLLDNRLSYNLYEGFGNQGAGQTGSVGVGYNGASANSSGSYSFSRTSRSVNASVSGGVLLHPHGLLFAPYLGDTVGLISVPDVAGVKTTSGQQATNSGGYALVPYLSIYQKNMLSLDPTTFPNNVEVLQNSMNVYPTRGAVVEARFQARVGQRVLMTLMYKGKPVPFGAVAVIKGDRFGTDQGNIVADAGAVYLSGLSKQGVLNVSWGRGVDQQCQVQFDLPAEIRRKPALANALLMQFVANCEPVDVTDKQ